MLCSCSLNRIMLLKESCPNRSKDFLVHSAKLSYRQILNSIESLLFQRTNCCLKMEPLDAQSSKIPFLLSKFNFIVSVKFWTGLDRFKDLYGSLHNFAKNGCYNFYFEFSEASFKDYLQDSSHLQLGKYETWKQENLMLKIWILKNIRGNILNFLPTFAGQYLVG